MSGLSGKVGPWELSWSQVPRGPSGTAQVKLKDGTQCEVRWRKDAEGIWIELPDGVYGFDILAERTDEGTKTYRLIQRGSDQSWSGANFARAGEEAAVAGAGAKKKGVRIRAQMPGKIVRVLIQPGQEVQKDQSLIVMEAMKMENEIRSPQAGIVALVKVTEGQTVETGSDLATLE